MRRTILVAASALLVSTPAVAAYLADGPESDKDRRVCKETQRTGTRFARPICRTVAEWEKISENAKRSASEMVNRPMINPRSNRPGE